MTFSQVAAELLTARPTFLNNYKLAAVSYYCWRLFLILLIHNVLRQINFVAAIESAFWS